MMDLALILLFYIVNNQLNSNKLYFQSERQYRQYAQYFHIARYDNLFYHINCGVIQGFLALRKAETTHYTSISCVLFLLPYVSM